MGTPYSTTILNMRSDTFGLDFTRGEGTPDSIPNMRSDIFGLNFTDLFGLDFTSGYFIYYECAQHEIIYILVWILHVRTPYSTTILNMRSDTFGLDFTRGEGTPDSIPNMRSDIFGLGFTRGDSIFYTQHEVRCTVFGLDFTDLFGLDFTRGYSIFYKYAQHEIRYIWFGFYTRGTPDSLLYNQHKGR